MSISILRIPAPRELSYPIMDVGRHRVHEYFFGGRMSLLPCGISIPLSETIVVMVDEETNRMAPCRMSVGWAIVYRGKQATTTQVNYLQSQPHKERWRYLMPNLLGFCVFLAVERRSEDDSEGANDVPMLKLATPGPGPLPSAFLIAMNVFLGSEGVVP